jgi:hypothetical protein
VYKPLPTTPPCTPSSAPTLPPVQRLAPLDIEACSLQRSIAQRGKRPRTPRSATWDNRDTQAETNRLKPRLRAETWMTAAGCQKANHAAKEIVLAALGTVKYRMAIKDRQVEEELLECARAGLPEHVYQYDAESGRKLCVARTMTRDDRDIQAGADRSRKLIRASTSLNEPTYREAFNDVAGMVGDSTRDYIYAEFTRDKTPIEDRKDELPDCLRTGKYRGHRDT